MLMTIAEITIDDRRNKLESGFQDDELFLKVWSGNSLEALEKTTSTLIEPHLQV